MRRIFFCGGVSGVDSRCEAGLACCSRGCFSRAAPRGVVAAARRGGVFACGLQRRALSAFYAARVLAAARRGGVLLASCSGGCFLRAAPRGGLAAARRDRALLVSGPEAASFALRRAGCCVGAGPAGRCGRFSCFAHAPLIKKSGQKRNHGLLWPTLPSSRGVWGTRASAALRAVSVGDRGRKGSFGCVGKILGGGFALRSEVPCCVAPKGGPVFRNRNGRCGLLQSSHLGGFAARCALRAALRRTRGRPRSPNAKFINTVFPPRLREPRPFFWAAFLSLRRLRCGKKSRDPGLLTAAFVQLEAAPLE